MLKAILIAFLSFLPIYAWLNILLERDPRKEPKIFILLTFLIGGATTILAIFVEKPLLFNFLPEELLDYARFDLYIIFTFIFAAIEEILKFTLPRATIFHVKSFDEPIDGMIYMGVAGLGFAFVENILFSLKADILNAIPIITVRGLSSNLLHLIASGIVGYSFILGILNNKRTIFYLGLLIASLLHTLYNLMVVDFKFYGFLLFMMIGALTILLFEIKIFNKKVLEKS
jgi:RsiW-degrading membrane proteinase PrsW (M82 family)